MEDNKEIKEWCMWVDPVARIISMKEIANGKFNIDIKNSNFAEIDELVVSCKDMAAQLNELYSSLESKVQQRTIALEEANHKLQALLQLNLPY